MTCKIKQSKHEIWIASWDIKVDPRPVKQALGFEPEAMIVIQHYGETLSLPIEKLGRHYPEVAQEAANGDPRILAGRIVTAASYMGGFRKFEDKEVFRRVVEYTPLFIASLCALLDSRFIYLKCGPIDPVTDNFKIQIMPTNATSADELRALLNQKEAV